MSADVLRQVEEAGDALLTRLAECEKATEKIYVSAYIHGVKYDGPTYAAEVDAFRAALASLRGMRCVEGWASDRGLAWIVDTEPDGEGGGWRPALLLLPPESEGRDG